MGRGGRTGVCSRRCGRRNCDPRRTGNYVGSAYSPCPLVCRVTSAFYPGIYWAGKAARERARYWPVFALGGFYLWGAGVLVLHYGPEWKLLRPARDLMPFTLFMAAFTAIASVAAQWFAARQAH